MIIDPAKSVAKKEPSAIYRWTILVFVSLAMFGNYYVYDSISPLADLLSKQLNFSDSDIGLLNGIYSFPNLFMVFIGGIIIDKIGTRISTFIFSALCMLGAVITAFSGGDLTVMAIGRLVFGLGAESLIVAVTTVLGRWFKGKKLSFAFGINLTIARLGTFAALNSPTWAKDYYGDWQGPLFIAAIAGFVSVISVIVYWLMDLYAEKNFAVRSVPKQDEIKFKEMFSFSKSFWYVSLLCVTFYSGIFPFQTFAVKFFMNVHFVDIQDVIARSLGSFLSSLLILSSMILTPIFGILVDKIGKRSTLMMIGSILLIPVYLILNYYRIDPSLTPDITQLLADNNTETTNIFSQFILFFQNFANMTSFLFKYFPNLLFTMAIMGLSFSLIPAVMWPSVALIVDESKLGTAYGLMTMIQAIGLTGFNFLIGWVNDYTGGYSAGMWIFSVLGFFGMFFAYMLRRSEKGPGGHGLEKANPKID